MTVRKQADQESLHHVLLSHDDLADLHLEKIDKRTLALDLFINGLDVVRHVSSWVDSISVSAGKA